MKAPEIEEVKIVESIQRTYDTESILWFDNENSWNPSIWDYSFDENFDDDMEEIWFDLPFYDEPDNHPPVPVVLYASNFSPPTYYELPKIGNNGPHSQSKFILNMLSPSKSLISPFFQKLEKEIWMRPHLAMKNGKFVTLSYEKMLFDTKHFKVECTLLSDKDISFYLWFKENYKAYYNSLFNGFEFPDCKDIGFDLLMDYLYQWLSTINATSFLNRLDSCTDMLGGEEIDIHQSFSKHISTLSAEFVELKSDSWMEENKIQPTNCWETIEKQVDGEHLSLVLCKSVEVNPIKISTPKACGKSSKSSVQLFLSGSIGVIPAPTLQNFAFCASIFKSDYAGFVYIPLIGFGGKTWKFRHKYLLVYQNLWFCLLFIDLHDFRLASFLAGLLKLDLWATDIGNPCDLNFDYY